MNILRQKNAGQTLLEAVVALAAILIVVAAVAISITTALNNTNYSKNQNSAAKYAQEGMEYIRSVRNDNLTTFNSYNGGPYCLNDAKNLALCAPAVDVASQYIRIVSFSPGSCANSETQVTVTVSWSDGKCSSSNRFCHQSQLISCFVNTSGGSNL